jgi:hypothetical protein
MAPIQCRRPRTDMARPRQASPERYDCEYKRNGTHRSSRITEQPGGTTNNAEETFPKIARRPFRGSGFNPLDQSPKGRSRTHSHFSLARISNP